LRALWAKTPQVHERATVDFIHFAPSPAFSLDCPA
jgi:hypothetical protein